MLKINSKHKLNIKLREKYPTITITNVCNLSCGGCHQLCGLFNKQKLWFMPLIEVEDNIKIVSKYYKGSHPIGIFGGEPTLHPEWQDILKLLFSFKNLNFVVYTNGRIHGAPSRIEEKNNVKFNISAKCHDEKVIENLEHLPQLVAPIDYEKDKSKKYFWKIAQKQCVLWNLCGKTIYNKKSYFCEAAAAVDHLEGGNRGWEIEKNKDPFEKTDLEITNQAMEFCYRCGNLWSGNWWEIENWNIKKELPNGLSIQKIKDPYLVSESNKNLIDQNKLNKIKLHVIN